MKTCYSCSDKPIRNGIYKSDLEKFIFQQLPKDNTHYHKIGAPSKIISGLKPNTCIFYFASKIIFILFQFVAIFKKSLRVYSHDCISFI